ncbi:substrate-binding periplasmic protein [Simiduia aestuariiviva]|uniref:Polar amino acid transport system substrate-binding protein n=1 Tax=Simiduia aestuariiviva TaxID=1510459 RepID=A0A839UH17_9GAMM|nr:transporter substrate-binding domain-containing protein [Simiduia aestuariiviva]MBB3167334.1 polar amino acid transport system substrate-binding protein [Simiduia aestuariiviva]
MFMRLKAPHSGATHILKFSLLLFTLIASSIFGSSAAEAGGTAPPVAQLNQLVFISEDYPPYNHLEDGTASGWAVELLVAASVSMNSPVNKTDIQFKPWARGMHETLNGNRRVLFSTSRTPERESLFKWAGPIVEEHVALVAKKSRHLQVTSVEQLRPLRFGVVRDDVTNEFLAPLKLNSSQLALGNNVTSIARMLQANRIDVWPVAPATAWAILEKIDLKPGDYEVVAYLKASTLYYAFSADVDDALVAEFQDTLDQLRRTNPKLFPKSDLDLIPLSLPPIQ